jgi:hypothetical protein
MVHTFSGRAPLFRATTLALAVVLLVALGAVLRVAHASAEVIYTSAVGKQNTDVALNAAGDAVAAWAEGNDTLKASVRPAGGSWSAPETIGATGRGNPYPHVVIDSTGFITLIWTSYQGSSHYMSVTTRTIGGSWSSVQDLDTGTYGENVALGIDPGGVVTAAWQSPSAAIRVASHPSASATWSSPASLGFGYSPTLASNATHRALAWAAITGPVDAVVIASADAWADGTVETPTLPGVSSLMPALAFGPGGILEAAWTEATIDTTDPDNPVTTETIHEAGRSAAGTWTNTGAALTDPTYISRSDGVAVDSNGDLTLLYYDTHADFTNQLKSLTRKSGTWQQPVTLSNSIYSSNAHLVVDADNTFTAVWADAPAMRSSRTSTVTWDPPTPLSDTGTVFDADVKLDGAGHALVGWTRQFTDGTGFHVNVEASFFTPAPPVDTTPPTTVLRPIAPITLGSHVALSWAAADTQSAVTGTDVRRRIAAWNKPFSGYTILLGNTALHTTSAPLGAGTTTCFSARSRDESANVEAYGPERCTTLPADDRVSARSRGWARKTGSAYYRGSELTTTKKGATLTVRGVHERSITLLVDRAPANGRIAVFWRGVKIGTWSLASATARHQQLITVRTNASVQTGTLVVKVLSKKKSVRIDGFAIRQ